MGEMDTLVLSSTVKLNDAGQVTIPYNIRSALDLKAKDLIEITVNRVVKRAGA